MNPTQPPGEQPEATTLTLPLLDTTHLFNAPAVVDPLAGGPPEALGVAGVDYLLGLLHLDKKLQQARKLTLLLPPAKASAASATDTLRALRRHVELRIESERRELRNTYRYGWRAAIVSLILLAVCIALSSIFTSDFTKDMRLITRTTFEYGFEIIGWVLLWHPVDVLAFSPLAIRARIAALQTLATVDVTIAPQQ